MIAQTVFLWLFCSFHSWWQVEFQDRSFRILVHTQTFPIHHIALKVMRKNDTRLSSPMGGSGSQSPVSAGPAIFVGSFAPHHPLIHGLLVPHWNNFAAFCCLRPFNQPADGMSTQRRKCNNVQAGALNNFLSKSASWNNQSLFVLFVFFTLPVGHGMSGWSVLSSTVRL